VVTNGRMAMIDVRRLAIDATRAARHAGATMGDKKPRNGVLNVTLHSQRLDSKKRGAYADLLP